MIKISKNKNNNLNKVIKNFNQKIARLEKINHEITPDKINKKEILQNVQNTKELNKKIAELKRFSKRNAEDILEINDYKILKWEHENIKRDIKIAKSKLTRKINTFETKKPTILGKLQDYSFSEMGDDTYMRNVNSRQILNKDISKLNKDELMRFKNYASKIIRRESDNNLKDNYLKMLDDVGFQWSHDDEKVKYIYEKLGKLSESQFIKIFNNDPGVKALIYHYDRRNQRSYDRSVEINTFIDEFYENIDSMIAYYQNN